MYKNLRITPNNPDEYDKSMRIFYFIENKYLKTDEIISENDNNNCHHDNDDINANGTYTIQTLTLKL